MAVAAVKTFLYVKEDLGPIGQGAFSAIKKVRLSDNKIYAMKETKPNGSDAERAAVRHEIGMFLIMLRKARDDVLGDHNIVRYCGQLSPSPGAHQLFMELCHGSVDDLAKSRRLCTHLQPPSAPPAADPLFRQLAFEMGKALGFVHSHRLIHFDVKPKNILYTHSRERGFKFLLADFGISNRASDRCFDVFRVGTPDFMAPELLDTHVPVRPTNAVDLWSLGVTLLEFAGAICRSCSGRSQSEHDFAYKLSQYGVRGHRDRRVHVDERGRANQRDEDLRWADRIGSLAQWVDLPNYAKGCLRHRVPDRWKAGDVRRVTQNAEKK